MAWSLKSALVALALLGLGVGATLAIQSASSDYRVHSIAPAAAAAAKFHYINMEGAAESALKSAAERYGLTPNASWDRAENEGSKCSRHVPARKNQVFWCQVLLEGNLVPVKMELISTLGFFRVIDVGENRALEEEHQQQLQSEYQERCEYEFPARGRRYHSCMYY